MLVTYDIFLGWKILSCLIGHDADVTVCESQLL